MPGDTQPQNDGVLGLCSFGRERPTARSPRPAACAELVLPSGEGPGSREILAQRLHVGAGRASPVVACPEWSRVRVDGVVVGRELLLADLIAAADLVVRRVDATVLIERYRRAQRRGALHDIVVEDVCLD